MQILGIHHVALNVVELDEAVSFYERVLGLSARPDRPADPGPGAWLAGDGFEVHLSVGETPTRVGQHFAIEVADFDAAFVEISGSGADVRAPQDSGDRGIRQFYVADPARNWIEIRERAAL